MADGLHREIEDADACATEAPAGCTREDPEDASQELDYGICP